MTNEERRAQYQRWEYLEASCSAYHCVMCRHSFSALGEWWKHQQAIHRNRHAAGEPPKMVCAVVEMKGQRFGFNLGLISNHVIASRLGSQFRLASDPTKDAPEHIDLIWGEPLRVVPIRT